MFKPGETVKLKKDKISKTFNWLRNRCEQKNFHMIKNKRLILSEDLAGYWIVRVIGTNNGVVIPEWSFEKEDFKDLYNKLKRED